MNIVFPQTTEIIDAIRSGIGRDAIFYTPNTVDCPTCEINPITNLSLDSFCPTCSGLGYIYTYSGYSILAHITHNPAEIQQYTSGGVTIEGDLRLQIKYTLQNEDIVSRTSYVLVDNKEYEIKKKTYRGFRDINRMLLDCIERTQ